MAQVSLRINGYAYILGCADGEEDHLRALAADLDQRIDDIKGAAGPSGEARLLLMAALMLSDELHDLRQQAEANPDTTKPAEKPDQKAARRLSRLAKRAETIADHVEFSGAGTAIAEPPATENRPVGNPPVGNPPVENPDVKNPFGENIAAPPEQP